MVSGMLKANMELGSMPPITAHLDPREAATSVVLFMNLPLPAGFFTLIDPG